MGAVKAVYPIHDMKAFKRSSNSELPQNKNTTSYRKMGMFFVRTKILEPSLQDTGPSLSRGISLSPNSLTLAQGYTYFLSGNRTTTQVTQESRHRRKSRLKDSSASLREHFWTSTLFPEWFCLLHKS